MHKELRSYGANSRCDRRKSGNVGLPFFTNKNFFNDSCFCRDCFAVCLLVETPGTLVYRLIKAATNRGKAIAARLFRDGHNLTIHDLPSKKDALSAFASELQQPAKSSPSPASASTTTPLPKIHIHASDIANPTAPTALVDDTVANLGPLHTFVANAGITQVKSCLDVTRADLQRMFEVNVFSVHESFAAAARQFIRQRPPPNHPPAKHGAATIPTPSAGCYKIIGGASTAAHIPFPGLSHYCASKCAVRGLTRGFASELARQGITVNSYAPGIVGTQMWEEIDAQIAEQTGKEKGSVVAKVVEEKVAMGRLSVPEDVSNLVSFLAGKDSDYMTGQTVVVDGGIVYT